MHACYQDADRLDVVFSPPKWISPGVYLNHLQISVKSWPFNTIAPEPPLDWMRKRLAFHSFARDHVLLSSFLFGYNADCLLKQKRGRRHFRELSRYSSQFLSLREARACGPRGRKFRIVASLPQSDAVAGQRRQQNGGPGGAGAVGGADWEAASVPGAGLGKRGGRDREDGARAGAPARMRGALPLGGLHSSAQGGPRERGSSAWGALRTWDGGGAMWGRVYFTISFRAQRPRLGLLTAGGGRSPPGITSRRPLQGGSPRTGLLL